MFQYRDETIEIGLLWISEGQYTNARNEINNITIETVFQLNFFWDFDRKKRSLQLWVTKEDEFECRENLLMRRSFQKIWSTRTLIQQTKQWFFTSMLFYRCYVSDWVHDWGSWTCSSWGIHFWKLSEVETAALLANFGLSIHWCKELKSTILASRTPLHLKRFRCPPWLKRWSL